MAQIMLLLCILSFSVKLGQISLEIKFYGSLNCKKNTVDLWSLMKMHLEHNTIISV